MLEKLHFSMGEKGLWKAVNIYYYGGGLQSDSAWLVLKSNNHVFFEPISIKVFHIKISTNRELPLSTPFHFMDHKHTNLILFLAYQNSAYSVFYTFINT